MAAGSAKLKGPAVTSSAGPDQRGGFAALHFLESAPMTIERLHVAGDAGFWPAAARAVLEFAAARCHLPPRQLHALTWVVPSPEHASHGGPCTRRSTAWPACRHASVRYTPGSACR